MEIFTGKNKKEFEKWWIQNYEKLCLVNKGGNEMQLDWFNDWPFSMQQGVYLEYLDSVEYHIEMGYQIIEGHKFFVTVYSRSITRVVGDFPTRQEALTAAFKKSNELINSNKQDNG